MPLAAAELQVYEGDSVQVPDGDLDLQWGQNYTFDATGLTVHSAGIQLNTSTGTQNISIQSDTSEQVNATLWKYNLSEPEVGDELIKVEVSAASGSQVDFRFTGLPDPTGDTEYHIGNTEEQLAADNTGGAVEWSHSDWSSHNFTVSLQRIETEDEEDSSDDGSTGGGGSSGGPVTLKPRGCTDSDLRSSHSWNLVDRNQFTLDDVDTGIGVQKVTVQTKSQLESLRLCTGKVQNVSNLDLEQPANAYAVYEVEASDSISQAEITFEVNNSYAETHDNVVLSRYHDGDWNELDTTHVDSTDETQVYTASTTGFSYFAAYGTNDTTTPPENGSEEDTDEPETNVTDPAPGEQENNLTDEPPENDTTEAPEETRESVSTPALIIGLLTVILLAATTYLLYQYYTRKTLEEDVKQLSEQIHEKQRAGETGNFEQVLSLVDRAEKALELGEYKEARKHVEKAEKIL